MSLFYNHNNRKARKNELKMICMNHVVSFFSELDIEFNEEISVIGFRKGGLWTPVSIKDQEVLKDLLSHN